MLYADMITYVCIEFQKNLIFFENISVKWLISEQRVFRLIYDAN